MNYDFVLQSKYDKTAYQALSEASWQLFRKRRLQTQAYPVMIAVSALILITLIYNWGSYEARFVVAALGFVAFVLAAIPLSALSAKAKMCRTAIKDASGRGEYPADIRFVFGKDTIHSTVGKHTATVHYGDVSCFALLGQWRFLFFGEAAFIIHASCFQSAEEAERFQAYIAEKCGVNPMPLKGTGPQRQVATD